MGRKLLIILIVLSIIIISGCLSSTDKAPAEQSTQVNESPNLNHQENGSQSNQTNTSQTSDVEGNQTQVQKVRVKLFESENAVVVYYGLKDDEVIKSIKIVNVIPLSINDQLLVTHIKVTNNAVKLASLVKGEAYNSNVLKYENGVLVTDLGTYNGEYKRTVVKLSKEGKLIGYLIIKPKSTVSVSPGFIKSVKVTKITRNQSEYLVDLDVEFTPVGRSVDGISMMFRVYSQGGEVSSNSVELGDNVHVQVKVPKSLVDTINDVQVMAVTEYSYNGVLITSATPVNMVLIKNALVSALGGGEQEPTSTTSMKFTHLYKVNVKILGEVPSNMSKIVDYKYLLVGDVVVGGLQKGEYTLSITSPESPMSVTLPVKTVDNTVVSLHVVLGVNDRSGLVKLSVIDDKSGSEVVSNTFKYDLSPEDPPVSASYKVDSTSIEIDYVPNNQTNILTSNEVIDMMSNALLVSDGAKFEKILMNAVEKGSLLVISTDDEVVVTNSVVQFLNTLKSVREVDLSCQSCGDTVHVKSGGLASVVSLIKLISNSFVQMSDSIVTVTVEPVDGGDITIGSMKGFKGDGGAFVLQDNVNGTISVGAQSKTKVLITVDFNIIDGFVIAPVGVHNGLFKQVIFSEIGQEEVQEGLGLPTDDYIVGEFKTIDFGGRVISIKNIVVLNLSEHMGLDVSQFGGLDKQKLQSISPDLKYLKYLFISRGCVMGEIITSEDVVNVGEQVNVNSLYNMHGVFIRVTSGLTDNGIEFGVSGTSHRFDNFDLIIIVKYRSENHGDLRFYSATGGVVSGVEKVSKDNSVVYRVPVNNQFFVKIEASNGLAEILSVQVMPVVGVSDLNVFLNEVGKGIAVIGDVYKVIVGV